MPSGTVVHPQVGVDLADATSCHDRLVDPEIQDAGRDAVEVGQLEGVEVGQAELAGQALHGEDVGDGVAGAEADHPDAERALAGLLCPGQLVAVAVEPEGMRRHAGRAAGPRPAPGVVDPALSLVHEGA